MRLRDAARLIDMSPSFLRKSSCPRSRKRGNGPGGKIILDFDPDRVLAWWASRDVDADCAPMRKAG